MRKFATQKTALENWAAEHKVFFHDRQDAIQLDSSKLFPTTLCRFHSVCVCGRSANSHPDALHFFRSLVVRMKDIFSKTKTHISVQRLLLQKGHIVLKFRKKPPEAGSDGEVDLLPSHEVYFCVGYINFKTWLFSGVHLLKILDRNPNGYLELAPWCCVEERWGTNHGVRTIVQFVAEQFDFGSEYALKIYKLVDDDTPLPEEFMVGTCVEVEAFESIGEFTCWKGSQTESQLRRKETQRKPGVKRPAAPADPDAADKDGQKKRRRTQRGKGKGPNNNNQLSFSALLALTDSSEQPSRDKVHSDDLDNLLRSAWDSPVPSPSECGQSQVGRGSDSGDAPSEACVLQEGEEEEGAFVEDTLVEDDAKDQEVDSFSYTPTTPLGQAEEDQILNELLQERSDDSDAETRTKPTETETPVGENAKTDKRDPVPSSSSSSSSSSTDSSSSDDDGPDQGALPALPRKTPLAESAVQYESHEIHYNFNGEYMRAHCSQHADCRRQRTVKPSKFAFHNRGQGRPIGLLTAWLDSAASFPTREDHVKARPAPLADRKAGRQKFKGTQEGLDFLKFERDQSQDTESEPEDIL
eukprot:s3006_g9.t1